MKTTAVRLRAANCGPAPCRRKRSAAFWSVTGVCACVRACVARVASVRVSCACVHAQEVCTRARGGCRKQPGNGKRKVRLRPRTHPHTHTHTRVFAHAQAPGRNVVRYQLSGNRALFDIHACIYLWEHTDKVVVCDIDGTVTRSDFLGYSAHLMVRDSTLSLRGRVGGGG